MSRGLQQFSEQCKTDAELVFLIGRQAVDVVIFDVHVEGPGAAGDLLADIAEPDDAERLVFELVELGRVEIVAAPAPGDDAFMQPDQFAGDRQHQHHRVLGDRGRIGAAIVADRHARRPRRVEVISVVAGAQGLDDAQFRRALVELRAMRELAAADIVFGVLQQVPEFGAAVRRHHQFPARRQQIVGDLQCLFGVAGGSQYARHRASPLGWDCRMLPRKRYRSDSRARLAQSAKAVA